MKKFLLCMLMFVFLMIVGPASADYADYIKIYRMSDPAVGQTYSEDAAGILESGVNYGIANNTPLKLYLCDNTGCYKEVPPWNNTSVTREEDTPFELHWETDKIEIHLIVPTPATPTLETPTPATPTLETPTPDPEIPLSESTPEPEVISPEDETGLYSLNGNGEKVYNWFHEYSTCMFYMGNKDFCSRFPLQ